MGMKRYPKPGLTRVAPIRRRKRPVKEPAWHLETYLELTTGDRKQLVMAMDLISAAMQTAVNPQLAVHSLTKAETIIRRVVIDAFWRVF